MFHTITVEKIKTHISCSIACFRKSCPLRDSVVKHGTARQATDDDITKRMRIACWITEVTNTHSEYVIVIAFLRQKLLQLYAPILRYTVHCL